MFLLLLQIGCGPSQEVATAQLLTALATKTQIYNTLSASFNTSVSVPAEVSCNKNVFILGTTGSMSIVGTLNNDTPDDATEATMDFSFQFNAQGPGIYGSVSTSGTSSSTSGTSSASPTPTPSATATTTTTGSNTVTNTSVTTISCSFTANFTYDPTAGMLSGSGTIPSCNHFQCVVNGVALDCTKFQQAMATTTCY